MDFSWEMHFDTHRVVFRLIDFIFLIFKIAKNNKKINKTKTKGKKKRYKKQKYRQIKFEKFL